MQIIIDIPKVMFINAKSDLLFGSAILVNAIKNGTPLPKGHGRLIDADKLKKVYENTEDAEYCKWTLYGVTSEIDDAPTIIEADKEVEE